MDVKILEVEKVSLPYALVVLYTSGEVQVEYFAEYPDLKLSHLVYTSTYNLYKEGIAGYAFYKVGEDCWQATHFRAYDSSWSKRLDIAAKNKLKRC